MKLKSSLIKLLATGLVSMAGMAHAVTPANTTITNTAQLSYTGLSSPITASVAIRVVLTPAAPTLSTPADLTVAENNSATYIYTITANANGNDVYNLGSSLTPSNLVSSSGNAVFTQGATSITSVTLGATAASAAASAGSATINVPSDGVAGGGVNGIVNGDTVVIDGNVYTVLSVADNGTTASITLTSNLVTAVDVGDLIAEQQTFVATIADVGTVNPTGSAADLTMDITATSVADAGQSATDQTFTVVVESTFVKYVRNVSNPNGVGAAVIVNGNPFFATANSVTAESGDVLEYALVVTAPATILNGVSLTDSIPAFTTYVTNSTTLNAAGVADVGANSPLIGGMAVNDAGSGPGIVGASQSAVVTFRVAID